MATPVKLAVSGLCRASRGGTTHATSWHHQCPACHSRRMWRRPRDGKSRATADPDWLSNVTTPNHPEYPAAHGCASSAVTHALEAFFGTDDLPFTVDSAAVGVVQPVHSYARFSDALEEVKRARVYGGMHYRNSTE